MTGRRGGQMRVLFLGNLAPFRVGGAEVQASLLSNALARRGHRVCAAGYANPNGTREAVTTVRLPTVRMHRWTRAASFCMSLGWFLIRHRRHFDVVVCNLLGESDVVAALFKWTGVFRRPLVACTAGHGPTGDAARLGRMPFARLGAWLIRNHCDAVNVLSPTIAAELVELGLDASRFTRIPYGIAADRHPVRPDRFAAGRRSFLFAGRLVPVKGIPDLIEAVRLLDTRGVPVRVAIAGEGPLEHRLRRLVRRCRLEHRIDFLGRVPPLRMPGLYADHAILVMPSRAEGFGLVAAEAMASGMPVIVTRSGGPEHFVSRQTGLTCPPGDPRALADAMEALAKMPAHRLAAMGRAAQQHIRKQHAIEHTADQYAALFRRLMNGKSETAAQTPGL